MAFGCSRHVLTPEDAAVFACSHLSLASSFGGISSSLIQARVAATTCPPAMVQAHQPNDGADPDKDSTRDERPRLQLRPCPCRLTVRFDISHGAHPDVLE